MREIDVFSPQARDSSIMLETRASILIKYSEGINFDWLNGWKCWTLASKNVQVEESNRRQEDREMEGHLRPLEKRKAT